MGNRALSDGKRPSGPSLMTKVMMLLSHISGILINRLSFVIPKKTTDDPGWRSLYSKPTIV